METALIIAGTALAGYFLKTTSEGIRNTNAVADTIPSQIDKLKMQATDVPVSSNIYNSNMFEDANNEELKRSLKHYSDSNNVSITGALPPIYNSYGAIGNSNLGNFNNGNIKELSDINNINRLANVSSTSKPPVLEDRPMFKPLTKYIGKEIEDNNDFSNFGQSQSNVNISLLTGKPLDNEHSNMTPFFGSNVKQNVESFANTSILDQYSGNTSTFKHKKELPKFFENYQEDIHGTPLITNTIETDRYIPSAFKQGEKPFYEDKVAAPIGFTITNPVTDASVSNKNIDELRVGTKPQISYEARKTGFKPQTTNLQTSILPVDKNRPETSFEWGHSRLFTGPAQVVAPQAPEDYSSNFQSTSRQDQNIEWVGPSKTQNADKTTPRLTRSQYDNSDELLVNFQEPKNQQFENQFQRNIGNTNLSKKLDDYNVSTFNPQFQQRETTSKMETININKSGVGQQVYAQDKMKSTVKQTTLKFDNSGNIKNNNLYKGDSEIYEVGNLNVTPRTTNKETTVKNKYKGQINKKDGMGYNIANYEAKTTNKQTTVKNNYNGHIADINKSPMDYTVYKDPIKVRHPARMKNYVGSGKTQGYTENENRDQYNNAQIDENKEKLLYSRPSNKGSGSGVLGQIDVGVELIGDIKSTDNMLLKEGYYPITQVGNTSSIIPSKNIIGQTDTLPTGNSEIPTTRLIGNVIENSLQNNPYYNLK